MIPYYTVPPLINQHTAHSMPQTEHCIGTIYHSAPTHLDNLDDLYRSFVRGLNLSLTGAFIQHNAAPPNLCRDVAMLGLLYKIVIGGAHNDCSDLFPIGLTTPHTQHTISTQLP